MIKSMMKRIILNQPKMILFLNRFILKNRFSLKDAEQCQLDIGRLLRNSNIYVKGSNNRIEVGKFSGIGTLNIHIQGNNNSIVLEDDIYCGDATLWIEDDNNCIYVKNKTAFTGRIQLCAIEGTKIEIGEECLFSSDIDIRTGDGHSLTNLNGKRTNFSRDILIGDHVWCGKDVSILKGGGVASESVIAAKSVCTKKFDEEHVVIAGVPASIVKQEVCWKYERI